MTTQKEITNFYNRMVFPSKTSHRAYSALVPNNVKGLKVGDFGCGQSLFMDSFKKATMVNVTQAGEDCMFIPIFNSPMLVVKQKWVNTTYTTALDWTGWTIYDDWVSPR